MAISDQTWHSSRTGDARARTAACALAAVAWLTACGAEDFPGAPGLDGSVDVPYVTTYNFGLKVGFSPIFGNNGNLLIISSSDLINMVSSANIVRAPATGVLSGRALDINGGVSVANVQLLATDVDGRPVGDFFYNSLGGTPDFVQTRGTTAGGAFTAFNVSPGQVFIKAVGGARGGTRLAAFPDEVSLDVVWVTPVVTPVVGVLGDISDGAGQSIPAAGSLGVEVVGQRLSEAVNCPDEVPTQTRVEAILKEPTSGNNTTAFRFCVASEGIYLARITGDASFVPTYQAFAADSARLTALQTTELTEFLTVYRRSELERAASVAGTTWDDRTEGELLKGVLAGQLTAGGAPRSGVEVHIIDEGGHELALPPGGDPNLGVIVYVDANGNPLSQNFTGGSGRFIALNLPIPGGKSSGTVYVTAVGQRITQGVPERFSAVGNAPVFAGAVSHRNVALVTHVTPIQGEDNNAPYFTGPVSGRVLREDGLAVVAGAAITPLGVPLADIPQVNPQDPQPEVFQTGSDGRYNVAFNPDPAAQTPLLQDETYLVRVEVPSETLPSGKLAYLPTYQYLKTGTTEIDSTTGLWKTKTQDLVVVRSSAVDSYRTDAGLNTVTSGTGVILGMAIDAKTNRPAPGVSVRLTALDGTDASATPSAQSASVSYFDFGGQPRPNLTATTPDGRFIVFNAPVGALSVDVSSPDDTGNTVADVRDGGVTMIRLRVNNAAPATVDVSGRFEPLVAGESASGEVTLTVAGGDPMPLRRLCPDTAFERGGVCFDKANPAQEVPKGAVPCGQSETYGPYRVLKKFKEKGVELEPYCAFEYSSSSPTFRVPVGSLREVVLKTSGADLVDTYTYGVTTGDRPLDDVSVGVVTKSAWSALEKGAGRTQAGDKAVVIGQATTASLGEVDSQGHPAPRTCASWTNLPGMSGDAGCAALGTPGAVAAGNFNDDTYRDLAVIDTTASDPAITIWLNTGDGSFARSQRIVKDQEDGKPCSMVPVPSLGCGIEEGPVALLVLDYNLDGFSDLIVLNQGSRSISLLAGRGRGMFVFGGSLVIGDAATVPNTLVSADFNRDGIPDLVITDQYTGEIILLLGNTAGFVRPPASIPAPQVGNDPRAVVSAQLDFDSIPDLVFVTQHNVSVMWRIGVTNDLVPYAVPTGQDADLSAVGIGDIDGNGFNDVVVADRAPGHLGTWVFLNSPFRLLSPTFIQAGPGLPIAVAVRDLNGDLSADLIVLHDDGNLMYREGDGLGGFGPERMYAVGGQPSLLIMDDVTGDGNEDAVIGDPVGARVIILPQTRQPVEGVAVAAVRADGRAVGDIVYLNSQGVPVPGASLTGASGRFAILNVPPDPVWLRLLTGGLGSRFLHAYPGAVTNTTFPIIKGFNATTSVSGVTSDAVLRPVGEVQIRFLGTQRVTSSNPLQFDVDGNTTGGANYSAVVDANSDYVVKLSR